MLVQLRLNPWPWLVRVIPPQASHVEPFLPPREFCTALLHTASYDVGTKKGNSCRRSLRALQWQAPRAGATSTGLTWGMREASACVCRISCLHLAMSVRWFSFY